MGQAWHLVDGKEDTAINSSGALPTYLHYSEIYQVEGWYFRKRQVVAHDVFHSCSAPLFAEPSAELLSRKARERDQKGEGTMLDRYSRSSPRHAWFMRMLLKQLNEAA